MSSQISENEQARFEQVSGYLDGELTQQEAQKVALLVETDSECRTLYNELKAMRQQVQSLSLQEQELEHLDKLFKEPVARRSRIFGLALIVLGGLLLVGLTVYKIFTHPELGLFEKSLVGILAGGSLLLLFSVLRQRLISIKNDKYRRIKI